MGVAPTTSSVPGTRSDSLSYKGLISGIRLAGTTRTCDPRLRRAVLSSTELRRAGVDGRGRTCTLRLRRPVPSPFGHVDVAPPTGLEPVTFCSTGSCSSRLSYGGVVRALGLEPSLVRGKSPVPYLSGVTRVVGREGIEPPMSGRRLVYSQLRPMARPTHVEARWRWPRRRCLCSCQGADGRTGCRHGSRLGRCRTPGRRCWRPRRHHWLEPKGGTRMTLCA